MFCTTATEHKVYIKKINWNITPSLNSCALYNGWNFNYSSRKRRQCSWSELAVPASHLFTLSPLKSTFLQVWIHDVFWRGLSCRYNGNEHFQSFDTGCSTEGLTPVLSSTETIFGHSCVSTIFLLPFSYSCSSALHDPHFLGVCHLVFFSGFLTLPLGEVFKQMGKGIPYGYRTMAFCSVLGYPLILHILNCPLCLLINPHSLLSYSFVY